MRHHWLYISLFGLMFSTVLGGCSAQKKLAKQYVEQSSEWGVLVLMPEHIFKFNERYDRDEKGMSQLSEFEKNQELLSQTLLMNTLNDSLVRVIFENAYLNTLRNYNVKVYTEPDFQDFYERDSLSWIVNVAQLELQEFIENYEDEDMFYGMSYLKVVPLNAINLAVWVEISQLNQSNQEAKVYFTDQNLFDQLESEFIYDFYTSQVNYYYSIDSLKTQDIYDFAGFMGRLSASYTYDQILNNKLEYELPKTEAEILFYRYDPFAKRLFSTEFDRFILLEK
ncbi:MAG: hypothetical protein M0Q90_10070 [Bacteroidales bacterium]|nr:hypothetical protein [Bacteroidales bacterium]